MLTGHVVAPLLALVKRLTATRAQLRVLLQPLVSCLRRTGIALFFRDSPLSPITQLCTVIRLVANHADASLAPNTSYHPRILISDPEEAVIAVTHRTIVEVGLCVSEMPLSPA